jgi:hypothetical protein
MKIECKLSSGTPQYKTICINNIYQVLFINQDFKSVDIYTGIVANGIKDANNNKGIDSSFNLEVEFSVLDDDDVNIKIEDIIDNFISEIEPIRAVWGDKCKVLTNQREISTCYGELYGEESNDIIEKLSAMPEKKFCIRSSRTKHNGSINIVRKAEIIRNKYQIKTNPDTHIDNIDNVGILTWTKTTISFKKLKNLSFSYKITMEDNNEETSYVITDTSAYYFMPVNYTLLNYSMNYLTDSGNEGEETQKTLLQEIAGSPNSDAYFKEWIINKNIENKIYYRLLLPAEIKEYKSLEMVFYLVSKIIERITSMIKGVLISCLFAFGMNKENMEEMSCYFFTSRNLDLWWFIISFSLLVSLLIKPYNDTNLFRKLWRLFSYLVLICWIVIAFFINLGLDSWKIELVKWLPIIFMGSIGLNFIVFRQRYDFSFFKSIKETWNKL